ncbi:HET domain-containing protein [Fusarium sp. LHS14.1]|nr:HET domain-containing protein [Fusarium sp. LHS14.1]
MAWSKSEIACMVLASPIIVPICAVCWIIMRSKDLAEATLTYLFHSALGDLIHFTKITWIRFGPHKQIRNEMLRKQNAAVFAPLFPGETRLLKLFPRQHWPDSGIYCEVVSIPRRELQYEVLSYDSREKELCRTINVDGHHVMVTDHLYLALRHLRANDTRNLWIEDLSTDGPDRENQGHQQDRESILREAFQVIIWLGTSPRKLKRLIPLFDESPSVAFEDDSGYTARIFSELLTRPWWNRLWSVQELALPPKVTVQCGRHRIPWANFAQTIELSYIDSNHSIETSRARTMALARTKYQSKITYEYGLLSLVWVFRESQVDDDRDKLYALLVLLPEEEQIIKFDYSKNVDQVYMEFVQVWINHYGSLLILNLNQRQQRRQHSTWYPRWSGPFGDYPQFFCGSTFSLRSHDFWEGKFSADGGRRAPTCIHSKNGRLLRLQGFSHDTIAAVSPSTYEPQGGAHTGWEECRKSWWEITRTWLPDDREGISQEFWLAITAGLVDSESSTINYESVLRATCEQRRLFITQNGQLGVGPSAVAPGDRVCVVFGSPVPFILSECKACNDDKGGNQDSGLVSSQTWRYLGDAYVHSIMHYAGDVDDDVETGRLYVEDFLLCG